MRIKTPLIKNAIIRWFVGQYNIDMTDAIATDPLSFKDFNSFFTRELNPEARPICTDENQIACPVDGTISQLGEIQNKQLIQAKGFNYSVESLVGGSEKLTKCFAQGSFATIYLSPKDYHRIHMPTGGKLIETLYIPGRLFSVNDRSVSSVPNLFSRNERVVAIFDTDYGSVAVILVGAIFVSGIETKWRKAFPRAYGQKIHRWRHQVSGDVNFNPEKGEEIGRFNMGSTVILLFENPVNFDPLMITNKKVKMGEFLAELGLKSGSPN